MCQNHAVLITNSDQQKASLGAVDSYLSDDLVKQLAEKVLSL